MRALLAGERFAGGYYAIDQPLAPRPDRQGPTLWVGSWGSPAGMRRVARLADGWLASAYNIAPEEFAARWTQLLERVETQGRGPRRSATGWPRCGSTSTRTGPTPCSPSGSPRWSTVPSTNSGGDWSSGPARPCWTRWRPSGGRVQWLLVWPVGRQAADDVEQLRRFHDEVMVPLQVLRRDGGQDPAKQASAPPASNVAVVQSTPSG